MITGRSRLIRRLCQTIGECRDLGDTYGSEHFTSFLGGLKASNQMSYLNVATEEDESDLAALMIGKMKNSLSLAMKL